MSTTTYSQNELMQTRANVIHKARELVNRAKEEKRPLNSEEREQYDRMMDEVRDLKDQADREHQLSDLEKSLEQPQRSAPDLRSEKSDLIWTPVNTSNRSFLGEDRYAVAFRNFLRRDIAAMQEFRALEQGVVSEGGALVPTPLLNAVSEIAAQSMSIYPLVSRYMTDSGRLDVPRVVTSGTAGAGLAEEGDFTSGSNDPAFGVVNLDCNNKKAYHWVPVSDELLSDSVIDLMAFLGRHIGNAIAEQDEQAYVSGNGTLKPTGFLPNVSVGQTTTAAFTYANLLALVASVRQGWRRNGAWVMNDTTFSQALALEDSGNTLIFKPADRAGENDRFLGYPIRTSFAMPGDSAGNKPIAFGDFSAAYTIVEKPLRVAMSEHALFSTGQIAVRADHRRDGNVIQADAVKVIHRTS